MEKKYYFSDETEDESELNDLLYQWGYEWEEIENMSYDEKIELLYGGNADFWDDLR